MDNESPSPPKRPRTIDFLTSQLGKPVRYFPFIRKSSSMIQQGKSDRIERVSMIKSQHTVSSSLPIPFSSTMKFVPNKEANISNKLQKLKLKSPDGRDLGEIKVQLLPQKGDGIGGKTIVLQKHSLFSKLDKPSSVSILKPAEKSKQTASDSPVFSLQITTTPNSHGNTGSSSVSVNTIRMVNTERETVPMKPIRHMKQKFEVQKSPLALRQSELSKYSTSLGSKVILVNLDKQTGVSTLKNVKNEVKNIPSSQKIIIVHAENYPDSTESKGNNSLDTVQESHTLSFNKEESGNELTSHIKTIPNVFWNPSKFSELSSKITIQKSKDNENAIVKSSGSISSNKPKVIVAQSEDSEPVNVIGKNSTTPVISNFQKKSNPKLHSWTILKTSSKKLEIGRGNCDGDDKELPKDNLDMSRVSQSPNVTVSSTVSESTQNIPSRSNISQPGKSEESDENVVVNAEHRNSAENSNSDQHLRENVMVILHGDVNTLKNTKKKRSEDKELSDKVVSMNISKGTEVNVLLDGSIIESNMEVLGRDSNPAQPDNSIMANAINSTPDTVSPKQQHLDIIQKALSSCPDQDLRNKALKALGDCGIGVTRDVPISPMVTVSDSQTQTSVFCLLEPENLVEYCENLPVLNKLNLVNRNEESSQIPYNSSICGNNYCNLNDEILLPEDFEITLDDLLTAESRKEIDKVKNVFTKPNSITQAFTQIQKDFEGATTVDSNGMMGIHRAVLSGNIKEVQRQLIILKAVKKSIEVPTNDGKTSLELAVLHEVNSRIVQVLLAAGAKPVFPLKLYESALIIASRTSSAVLSELVKHVTTPSLLDNLDSEGFAPLHYCAQRGNMQGIRALVTAGAFINLKDAKSGRTALFHALESRNFEMAGYLVENGASPNINNFAGQSPTASVDECRHNSLIEKFNQMVR